MADRSDRDLASLQEARTLARRAKQAAQVLAEFSQEQIDAVIDAMASAVTAQAEPLARLAHEETGYGVVADKVQKNLFASEKVYQFIRPMKTVGVIRRLEDRKVIEIAEPFGVVCAIVPTTNPTSTAIYKILIAIKARCPIVISPHPAAVRCITRVAEIMHEAARRAGAADVAKAVRDIVTGKTFDHGVLCSSENSVVVDAPLVDEVKRAFVANGGHFMSTAEIDAVGKILVSPQRLPNPALV